MNVTYTTKGTQAIARKLTRLADRVADPRPGFRDATSGFVAAEKERFDRLGHTKESTRQAKARSNDSRVRANQDRVGVATGDLREYLTTTGAGGQPAKMTTEEVVLGVPDRHRLAKRAQILARRGHNPVIPSLEVGRIAVRALTRHVTGRGRWDA